jgi:hypothetical protein
MRLNWPLLLAPVFLDDALDEINDICLNERGYLS